MWFIAAIVVATVVTALVFLLRDKGIKVAWYELLIAIVGVFLLLFSIQNYFGFNAEFEPDAATTALWMIGGPALLLFAIAGSLIWRRNRKASTT
jgi:ABC-type enterobactin transport system permease subunit